MATTNIFDKQIQNRNFLSPTGFKFTLNRAPKVAFFSNSANIPGMTLGVAVQPTYLKDIDTPGDKIVFDDFTLRFLVDEDLKNYMEIHNWIRGLGYPDSLKDIYDLQNQQEYVDMSKSKTMNIYSDGTLTILGSNLNPNFQNKFSDLMAIQFINIKF
jgi:hypothetical protein